MYLRAVQAHQEAGGTARKSQNMGDHVRGSYEEYTAKGGDLVGEIDDKIHSKMSKIKP